MTALQAQLEKQSENAALRSKMHTLQQQVAAACSDAELAREEKEAAERLADSRGTQITELESEKRKALDVAAVSYFRGVPLFCEFVRGRLDSWFCEQIRYVCGQASGAVG